MLTLTLPGLTLSACSAPGPGAEPRAVIVDQLSLLDPNQAFIDQVTAELEAYGFEVDVYQGKEVGVKFYRELPKYGYKLIIFRAHSGLMEHKEDSHVVRKETTYLFTGEAYEKTKYVREQLTDQMLKAEMVEDSPLVFAINSKFVMESMDGRFQDTVIIMMGCSCIYLGDMATAFILKGASTYLGWDATVGLGYVDQATANLITNLCDKEMAIEQAVAETMAEIGRDPEYHACLKYYPAQSGSQTIRELISRVD